MYFSGLVSSLSLKKRIETVQFLIPFVGTNSANEGSGVQGAIRNNPGKFNIQVRVRRFRIPCMCMLVRSVVVVCVVCVCVYKKEF